MNHSTVIDGEGIGRIPVTLPDGYRNLGSSFCVNITELSFEGDNATHTASSWTGYPFVSMKRC